MEVSMCLKELCWQRYDDDLLEIIATQLFPTNGTKLMKQEFFSSVDGRLVKPMHIKHLVDKGTGVGLVKDPPMLKLAYFLSKKTIICIVVCVRVLLPIFLGFIQPQVELILSKLLCCSQVINA